MEGYISLNELIRTVQNELIESQNERVASEQPILFETSELEIELNTIITQNATGKFTISVPLIKSEFDINSNDQFVQKIKLKLKVTDIDTELQDNETFLPPQNDIRNSGRFPKFKE